jgi:hypothetical protein
MMFFQESFDRSLSSGGCALSIHKDSMQKRHNFILRYASELSRGWCNYVLSLHCDSSVLDGISGRMHCVCSNARSRTHLVAAAGDGFALPHQLIAVEAEARRPEVDASRFATLVDDGDAS